MGVHGMNVEIKVVSDLKLAKIERTDHVTTVEVSPSHSGDAIVSQLAGLLSEEELTIALSLWSDSATPREFRIEDEVLYIAPGISHKI